MFKYLKISILSLALLMIFFSHGVINAVPRKSHTQKLYTTKLKPSKTCSKKAPYAGYGKPSKVNGYPKTKVVSGHVKRTRQGYTYVNPYARSK